MDFRRIIKSLFTNPMDFLRGVLVHIPWIVTDKAYIKVQYRAAFGHNLNLKDPKTFNEKLQWLKLYDHNPLYTEVVDKVLAKEYVKRVLGEEYVIPMIGVWNDPDEIEFDQLPNQFVLKCNHTGGGSVFVCKDKSQFDFEKVKKILKKQLHTNTFLRTREWPYKNIERKVFCEKYMEDEYGQLRDYKFFCFNGDVKMMFIATDRGVDTRFDFYDTNFNHIPVKQGYEWANQIIEKPKSFDRMMQLASILSKNIPHVRVDFYNINGKIYFGEMTFYQYSGLVPFDPAEWDLKFGELIKIPNK